jgi:hypothetical protein
VPSIGTPPVAVTFGGQVIVNGGPATVTVNVHDDELFDESVAVQVTVVTPSGNIDPEAGAQTTVGWEHASVAIGAG